MIHIEEVPEYVVSSINSNIKDNDKDFNHSKVYDELIYRLRKLAYKMRSIKHEEYQADEIDLLDEAADAIKFLSISEAINKDIIAVQRELIDKRLSLLKEIES